MTIKLTLGDIVKMALVLKPRWRVLKPLLRLKRKKTGCQGVPGGARPRGLSGGLF